MEQEKADALGIIDTAALAAVEAAFGDLMFNIVITGIVNLVFTFIAIFTVDRVGRRPLMLIGAGGLAGIYAVVGTGLSCRLG